MSNHLKTPAEMHGNDLLHGGEDNDVLIGQGASHVLVGGIGNDILLGDDYDKEGGTGRDIYIFNMGDGVGPLPLDLGDGDCRNGQQRVDQGNRRTAANEINWRCAA